MKYDTLTITNKPTGKTIGQLEDSNLKASPTLIATFAECTKPRFLMFLGCNTYSELIVELEDNVDAPYLHLIKEKAESTKIRYTGVNSLSHAKLMLKMFPDKGPEIRKAAATNKNVIEVVNV